MCGVAFLYTLMVSPSDVLQRMEAASQALKHRGPDEGTITAFNGGAIGHRRLSIIDLASSKQPMASPDGRYLLSYNGEIYNYLLLRRSLESRWDFTTEGDTEVLLAGLVLDGERFLQQLNGMWGFALWDQHTCSLLLSRDRMGEKPLYFQELNGGGFACASELPALERLAPARWEEDDDAISDYLRHGYFLPGSTAFRGVSEVLPGHVARWRPGHKAAQQSYWSLSFSSYKGDKDEAQERLRSTFENAIKLRLVSDVEVGAFLSGGIDSSLITALASKYSLHPVKTFTIGFSESAFDERTYARLAADHFGTRHYEETLDSWNAEHLEELILNNIGQPFADASLLPTALVSKVAAQHVKVVLSGDGADELFCGYQRYLARVLMQWYSRIPSPGKSLLERAVRSLPEPMAHHSRSLLKKAHLFIDIRERYQAESPYVAPWQFTPTQLAQIAPSVIGRGRQPPYVPDSATLDDLHRMMFSDCLVYLPQDILVKVDRASMSESLESRAPFLDVNVIELAFQCPIEWHQRHLKGKQMLRETFRDVLPNTLWKRRKQGFGVPLHSWFRGELGNRLRTMLARDPAIFNPGAVNRMLEQHIRKQRDHGYRLWQIFVYLLWHQNRT